MRFLYVDAGNDPSFAKGERHGVTGYFLPLWDVRCTPANLVEIRKRGKVAGVYVGLGANHWKQTENKSPEEAVGVAAVEFKRLKAGMEKLLPGSSKDLRVQWNDEQHNADQITRTLRESRRLLPGVGTSWTLEGKQATWFDGAVGAEMIRAIKETKTRVVPQLYNGTMTAHYDPKPEIAKWVAYGVPKGQVSPMWDAKLVAEANGYLFTQGRLP